MYLIIFASTDQKNISWSSQQLVFYHECELWGENIRLVCVVELDTVMLAKQGIYWTLLEAN